MTVPLIFSDVDGTILDYDTYAYTHSLRAIEKLAGRDIPLILTSSKTRTEMQLLHRELDLRWPFIFENGAGIAYPDGTYTVYGLTYEHLVGYKTIVETLMGAVVWCDTLTEMQLSAYTGLAAAQIRNMMERTASVLFLPPKKVDAHEVNRHLKEHGAAITTGGKFFTLGDSNADKGNAVRVIRNFYQENGQQVYTYAIGDGINDIAMFNAADEAYFVGDRALEPIIKRGCKKIQSCVQGPEGFSKVIESIITNHCKT